MNPSYSTKWVLLAVAVSTINFSLGCGGQKKVPTLYVATDGNDNWSGNLPSNGKLITAAFCFYTIYK